MTPQELRARTAAFAKAVHLFCQPLLTRPEARSAAEQLLKASASVAANHRAAGKARSHAEFAAKIGTVDEEADESVFWIEHLRRCRLVAAEESDTLLYEAVELSAIFTASAKTARTKEQAQQAERRRRPGQSRRQRRSGRE